MPAKAKSRTSATGSSGPDGSVLGGPVGTLERGLSILRFFKTSSSATIPEVAEALGLSRSTTYRIADRLRELDFLEVNPSTNRWRLGREAVQLGVVALQST